MTFKKNGKAYQYPRLVIRVHENEWSMLNTIRSLVGGGNIYNHPPGNESSFVLVIAKWPIILKVGSLLQEHGQGHENLEKFSDILPRLSVPNERIELFLGSKGLDEVADASS